VRTEFSREQTGFRSHIQLAVYSVYLSSSLSVLDSVLLRYRFLDWLDNVHIKYRDNYSNYVTRNKRTTLVN
jgi:hypothetical protein